jgi:cation:H+ antiporter
MMMILQVVAGFVFLLVGAEFLVRGAVALAKRWGVSALVIGMTVVAMGTSAPELVVSVGAALSGSTGMALGNVVGSNIANVLLILGATGLVRSIRSEPKGLYPDAVSLMGGSLVFAWLCVNGTIGFAGGLVLLILFFAFLGNSYWQESRAIAAGKMAEADDIHVKEVAELTGLPRSLWLMIASIAVGVAGLWLGAELLVGGGTAIARTLGVSDEVIGLTLIALGTSLPELAASVMAALRGHTDVALGNVVGSNLFNILGVAGATAVITPLPVPEQMIRFDLWVMLAATALVLPFLVRGKHFDRPLAGVFLFGYVVYIAIQHVGVGALLGS